MGSWIASPTPAAREPPNLPPEMEDPALELAPRFRDATLTSVVHLTAGGRRLRVHFSNLYGQTALRIGSVRVANSSASRGVTFEGHAQSLLAPGKTAVSDPLEFVTSADSDLIISVFYPALIPREPTLHRDDGGRNLLASGDASHGNQSESNSQPLPYRYFLSGVDVETTGPCKAIIAIGDSITDGGAEKWPALLATRLHEEGKSYAVLNAGINGNRILHDGRGPWTEYGQSALSRFDRDVLDQAGVRYVIVYEGINDLGHGRTVFDSSDTPNVASIEDGIGRLAARAHQRGFKVFVATLTPFEGIPFPGIYTPEKNDARRELNEWIRLSKDIDGYLDFDRALADPAQPNRIKSDFDSDDHMHPNDMGEAALSKAIDSSLFE
jgi:lysophospholipase L1-like esterase